MSDHARAMLEAAVDAYRFGAIESAEMLCQVLVDIYPLSDEATLAKRYLAEWGVPVVNKDDAPASRGIGP